VKTKLFWTCLWLGLVVPVFAQPGMEIWDFHTTDPILSSPAIGPDGT
jgi:hypothetical protein